MKHPPKQEMVLRLTADQAFLPVATSFMERAAQAFGLEEDESLSLTLATEEIFAYLCRHVVPGHTVEVICRGGGYYVDAVFLFPARDFDLKVMNITASIELDSEAGMEEAGLLIASRMVDHFSLTRESARLRLTLTRHKAYPVQTDSGAPAARPLDRFVVRHAQVEELKMLVRMVSHWYGAHLVPDCLRFSGRLVDMVVSGDYTTLVAVDEAHHIGGAIVWWWEGRRTVECFGPYVFGQGQESPVPHALVDACIAALARTHAVGVVNRNPTPELPPGYFESLGSLSVAGAEGTPVALQAFYRHLREDEGAASWCHPCIEEYLRAEYQRLVLARELVPVHAEGEALSPFTVLSTAFDRARGIAMLRPVWLGLDCEEVVASHVATLAHEEIPTVLLEMDLADPWQCHFAPALLANGFCPRLILPHAGNGDLVVFQHGNGGCGS